MCKRGCNTLQRCYSTRNNKLFLALLPRRSLATPRAVPMQGAGRGQAGGEGVCMVAAGWQRKSRREEKGVSGKANSF